MSNGTQQAWRYEPFLGRKWTGLDTGQRMGTGQCKIRQSGGRRRRTDRADGQMVSTNSIQTGGVQQDSLEPESVDRSGCGAGVPPPLPCRRSPAPPPCHGRPLGQEGQPRSHPSRYRTRPSAPPDADRRLCRRRGTTSQSTKRPVAGLKTQEKLYRLLASKTTHSLAGFKTSEV